MAENSADEFSFAVKCVLERFSYRQIKGKDVLVLKPTASGKSVIFQSFPLIFDAALISEIQKPVRFTSCAGCALVILSLCSARLCRTKQGSLPQSM